ncbi:hypothetical protein KSP39_PZI004703 [Platanthera zijinensis]|uniref:Uncharacterized protein n=1 Tax=Platanthera zijinensis TaxID=2320716 RepID=A0AAP0BVP8_9ASPA
MRVDGRRRHKAGLNLPVQSFPIKPRRLGAEPAGSAHMGGGGGGGRPAPSLPRGINTSRACSARACNELFRLFKFPGDGKKLQNVDELIASTLSPKNQNDFLRTFTGEICAVVQSRASAVDDDLIHELPGLEIIASFSMGVQQDRHRRVQGEGDSCQCRREFII